MTHAPEAEGLPSGCHCAFQGDVPLGRDGEIGRQRELALSLAAMNRPKVQVDLGEDEQMLTSTRLDLHLSGGEFAASLQQQQRVACEPVERVVAGREGLALGGERCDLESHLLFATVRHELHHLRKEPGRVSRRVQDEHGPAAMAKRVVDLDTTGTDEVREYIEGSG